MEVKDTAEDQNVGNSTSCDSRPFKVCTNDRKRKVGLVASSFEELKCKCQQKFSLKETGVTFVTEDDGTEVDSEFLCTVRQGTTLMVLKDGEEWHRMVSPSGQIGSIENADITMSIIESLRANKRKRTTKEMQENRKVKQHSVHVGWMNFSYRDRKYHLIKGTKDNMNSGPRTMKLDSNSTFKEIQSQLKSTFFPNRSFLGPERRFTFTVGNFDGHGIDESTTLHEHVAGNTKPRVYLLSKEIPCWTLVSDSDTDSDFLPEIKPPLKRHKNKEPAHTVTSEEAAIADLSDLPDIPDVDFLSDSADFFSCQGNTVNVTNSTVSTNATGTDSTVLAMATGNSTVNNFLGTGQKADTPPDVLSPFVDSGTPTVSLKPKLCIVCFDREPTAFYYPFGHTSCLPCALHIFESIVGKKCPTCRLKIEAVRNIYNDN